MNLGDFIRKGYCAYNSSWLSCDLMWFSIAGIVLGSAIFRKTIANDMLGMDFSWIGSSVSGGLGVYIMSLIFHSTKWALVVGIVAALVGGFFGGKFLPDKESDGESSTGGYDEA